MNKVQINSTILTPIRVYVIHLYILSSTTQLFFFCQYLSTGRKWKNVIGGLDNPAKPIKYCLAVVCVIHYSSVNSAIAFSITNTNAKSRSCFLLRTKVVFALTRLAGM